jgi:hypothetical protein
VTAIINLNDSSSISSISLEWCSELLLMSGFISTYASHTSSTTFFLVNTRYSTTVICFINDNDVTAQCWHWLVDTACDCTLLEALIAHISIIAPAVIMFYIHQQAISHHGSA